MRDAITWYRKEGGPQLALEMANAFEQAANSAVAKPMSHRAYELVPPVRRVVIGRFPYVVFFVVEADTVVVLDAVHTSQKPPVTF